jgi:hypothetical protein
MSTNELNEITRKKKLQIQPVVVEALHKRFPSSTSPTSEIPPTLTESDAHDENEPIASASATGEASTSDKAIQKPTPPQVKRSSSYLEQVTNMASAYLPASLVSHLPHSKSTVVAGGSTKTTTDPIEKVVAGESNLPSDQLN